MNPGTVINHDTPSTHQEQRSPERTWRPLLFFNSYRLLLSVLFIWLYHNAPLPPPLGMYDPRLFYQTSLVMFGFSLLAMATLAWKKPGFNLQLYTQVFTDIVLVTLLIHASGGVSSGLGMLLVISVANGSMLARGIIPGFMAALATIAVLFQQTYTFLNQSQASFSYPHAGVLGVTLFATALLTHALAKRARQSEALASQRGLDLANMAQLTEYVIQQMDTGVLTVDQGGKIHLVNRACLQMLDIPENALNHQLDDLSSKLGQDYRQWLGDQKHQPRLLHNEESGHDIRASIMAINTNNKVGGLIFLEDVTETQQQAQQLKLASLGRLTASIAHEVRNPLGAISHAGELLAESPDLPPHDKRLTQIIIEQSRRVNIIIENVLQLGRSDRTQTENVNLTAWLDRYFAECRETTHINHAAVRICHDEPNLVVSFDPNHLQQILWNLCQNALHHTREITTGMRIELHTGRYDEQEAFLDVIDFGPGISGEAVAHIFEPFFTTESRGTGLGLYICRELASANHGHLQYRRTADGHSRFRLLLPLTPQQETE